MSFNIMTLYEQNTTRYHMAKFTCIIFLKHAQLKFREMRK